MKIQYIEEPNGCWRCTSHCLNDNGYVMLTIGRKQISGHRYIYQLFKGKIKNEVVRHTCDNRWCVNPNHLIEGTHSDNVQDRVKRDRSAKGITNGRHKLSEESVRDIFYDNSTPKMVIAKKHGVDPKVVRDIKNRITWRHLSF